MRTLLIDNYDSFTFNLFQDLAVVNGCEPTVIRNDELTWNEIERLEFDNIVISPGPGRPERIEDFGVCAEVIAKAGVPILGVCLGHQGIGHAFGARVRLAPEPMHGRSSAVFHRGTGLFKGLPSPFHVVRYHSLIVDKELSHDLVLEAWTEEGIVMGLRHRRLPIWGVQFHPESICTEHGRALLENFKELSRELLKSRGRTRSRSVSTREPVEGEGEARLLESAAVYQLRVRRLDFEISAELLFENCFRDSSTAFWLDSAAKTGELGRFSFLGSASGPLSEIITYDQASGILHFEREGTATSVVGDVFEYLDRKLRILKARVKISEGSPELPFDFNGGFVGYFGYEARPGGGRTGVAKSAAPDALWVFADRVIAIDHVAKATYLLQVLDGSRADKGEEWEQEMLAHIERIRLQTEPELVELVQAAQIDGDHRAGEDPVFRLRDSREELVGKIQRCLELIREGESYEICLTTAVRALREPAKGPCPLHVYRVLRRLNPAPFGAYLRWKDTHVLCSSPERFLRVDQNAQMEAKPIKGTIKRGTDPSEDELLKERLRTNEKERAENLMIVDLLRNDLGSVATVGTVQVPKLMDIESFATVHQMVSTVRGQLRPGSTAIDAVKAAFPGGSMTGAPKKRTMEILEGLEGSARGVYSGALGFFALNGSMDLNIVIRTLVMTPHESSIGVGAAIVALSDPEAEVSEMLLKAQAPMKALEVAYRGSKALTADLPKLF